ncbi:alpha/beta hydrolase [Chitinophaga agrisoli]|uniref:Alpha/beta hydrolase n=1 Tax=Chitinophaga agrisoli TaxID=2607653 RepID=A0A5B2VLI8_9BACT|nr:alpha/beta hydrolase [Chitinophaga agrisoli]KAA2239356.1 alpha/beta hydrolase [Chitinophaga agrisoli]
MLTEIEKTYIFIPGGWHGGWAFDPITERLGKLGKKCIAITLPGLEPAPAVQNGIINLDTHIQYVVDFILNANIANVILCGHSYAGMVMTGVADKIPERIYSLVYIDAYVPEDGDSCWRLTSEAYRHVFASGAGADGFTVAVPPGAETRRRPHPLATFMQNLQLTGDYLRVRNRTFIYLSGWEQTPFKRQYENLKAAEDWHVETVHCAHNIMREAPDKLTDILIGPKIYGNN